MRKLHIGCFADLDNCLFVAHGFFADQDKLVRISTDNFLKGFEILPTAPIKCLHYKFNIKKLDLIYS